MSDHCYAVVNYTASSSSPFQVYNPWGDTSSGMAPCTFNGHQVYGLFSANGTFLSQNFVGQAFGTGAAVVAESGGVETWTHRGVEAATDLLLAKWALSQN